MRVAEHWNRLPGEALQSPLKIFKTQMISCVIYSRESALAGMLDWVNPEFPSNAYNSCEKQESLCVKIKIGQ